MRASYVAGTASTGKQILSNAFIKRKLPYHNCVKSINYSSHETAMSCDKYVYVFSNNMYKFYCITEDTNDDLFTCVQIGKRPFKPIETPGLDWSQVGVFKFAGLDSEPRVLSRNQISGKAIIVDNLIITCPCNILRE
jgi:hypothetical protein